MIHKQNGYHIFHKGLWLLNINSLGKGTSFGEQAIMDTELKPRTATIFCNKDCLFGVINKTTYQKIIGEFKKREIRNKIIFLKKTTLFKRMEENELETLIYFLESTKYKNNQTIVKQGSQIDMIYIIKSGEVKVLIY